MIVLNILTLAAIIHALDGFYDTCEDDELEFWKNKYYENYQGKDAPEKRCVKEDGYCLRGQEVCQGLAGDHVRYQTECYNRCDCCFRGGQRRGSYLSSWRLVKKRLAWGVASDWCRFHFSGDLLVPENIAHVIKYIKENKLEATDVWVGISDAHEGDFEGIYGNVINGGWQLGQPKLEAEPGENCVAVEDDVFFGPGIKVEPCGAGNYFICDAADDERINSQHPVIFNDKLSTENSNGQGLGSDREEHYGTRIKILGKRKSWDDARLDCHARGGDLLVLESAASFINYMRQENVGARDVWVGYSDKYYPEEYEGVHGNIIEGGWQPGEPRYIEPGKDCVVIEDDPRDGAGLKVEPCYEKHIYACDLTADFDSEHSTYE